VDATASVGSPVGMRPFEDVVSEHGAAMLRVCRALVGAADAEDACAEALLAALRAYPRLRPESDVRAWLVTIAHRKAVDVLRARARRSRARTGLAPRTAATSPHDPDPALAAALAALPFKQRACVTHHHLGGLSYAEVGALLGTTAAAARRSAADGIATLRTRLKKGARS
jgi:RNA polymerase sigma factor (sigma-70 family)